jgi:hypothetical protein
MLTDAPEVFREQYHVTPAVDIVPGWRERRSDSESHQPFDSLLQYHCTAPADAAEDIWYRSMNPNQIVPAIEARS